MQTMHVQKVWEVFKRKNLGEYHDLYVQCNALRRQGRINRSWCEQNATRAAIADHKTCFILWHAIVVHPKGLWRPIKIVWDIIMKVAPKAYLKFWRRSHWLGNGVGEECSKSEHLNGDVQVNISMMNPTSLGSSPVAVTQYVTCSLKDHSSFGVSESSTKLSYLHNEEGNKCMA